MSVIANIIWFVHICLIVANITIPFTKVFTLQLLHVLMIPFIFLHWHLNDNRCCLTALENKFRNVSHEELFFQKLMGPIYTPCGFSILLLTGILWCISFNKILAYKNG